MNIPKKDLSIIDEIASYVAYGNRINGYHDEDLKQDMIVYGLQSYQKWDDEKHRAKGEAKRDNNLKIFLKTYMTQRLNNMYKKNKTLKRRANLNVTSLNPGDPAYEILTNSSRGESKELTNEDFCGLNLSEEQIKVLLYIADNGLENIDKELDIGPNRVKSIINSLSQNTTLYSLLKERLQTP